MLTTVIAVVTVAIVFVVYVSDYYHSEVTVVYGEKDGIQITEGKNYIEFCQKREKRKPLLFFIPEPRCNILLIYHLWKGWPGRELSVI